ncbi:MAG: hypothetical protein E4H31_02110 [Dehalococcoidia bacterium]|nr:MAG: hypothetical protein E4H31_02110 [Dehalococcoidia bacterium]
MSEYRQRAWRAYSRMNMPITSEEAWRRTDLRALPAENFRLPAEGAFEDLPAVPAHLLKPLVADQHGGQIVLTPGGAQVDLDSKLANQGVVFTDLKTAEQKYPELLAKMVGKTVNPEEGKFASLAAAFCP